MYFDPHLPSPRARELRPDRRPLPRAYEIRLRAKRAAAPRSL